MARKSKRSAAGRVLRALLLDIVLIGVGLLVFALFHHVLPQQGVLVVDRSVESEVDPALEEALGNLGIGPVTPAPTPQITSAPEPTAFVTAEPTQFATEEPEPIVTEAPQITSAPQSTAMITAEPTAFVTAEPQEHVTKAPEITEMPQITAAPVEMAASPTQMAPFLGEKVGAVQIAAGETQISAEGDFSALFDSVVADTDEIRAEKTEYLSDDISIRISRNDTGKVVFYVADIYVRSIENFRTAFANDTYGRSQRAYAWDISMDNKAILSVNGDYYSARDDGVVIRNGVTYRDTIYQDICVLYRDGEMIAYAPEEFDIDAVNARGAWQAWSFGPSLLDDEGKAQKKFNSTVVNHNPRCGIGYYEPGHYCFVVVEGRNEASNGVTLAEFSLIFQQLGCSVAYNMDGGNTAVMTYGKRLVNEPSQGGRAVSDIIMISEVGDE